MLRSATIVNNRSVKQMAPNIMNLVVLVTFFALVLLPFSLYAGYVSKPGTTYTLRCVSKQETECSASAVHNQQCLPKEILQCVRILPYGKLENLVVAEIDLGKGKDTKADISFGKDNNPLADNDLDEEKEQVAYSSTSQAPPTVVDGVPSLNQAMATEKELTSRREITMMKDRLKTLPSEEVELVKPGRKANPLNTQLVEIIVSESDWEHLFPFRNPMYSYTNFLKAISKFPAVCSPSDPTTCRKVLATMFAHFTQETGAHNPSLQVPQWRQGLAHLEEMGCENHDCGYSAACGTTQWTAVAWPCGKTADGNYVSYHGRGAKQISYNYNYGQFSAAMYGNIRYLLDNPDIVKDTWLNLASAVWFFATPQPPKPSMLGVMEGDWEPTKEDLAGGLKPGFGVTINIINGAIECGKGNETVRAKERVEYYRNFARYLGVDTGSGLICGGMKQFGSAGAVAIFWEQSWSAKYQCKLVNYQTPYSALVQGDYVKCVQDKFGIKLS